MQTYYDNISIHAPLRGRQSWEHERIIIIIISIHAPLRGRLVRSARTQARGRFQSTPPCGGDKSAEALWRYVSISIHAPLRGRRWKNKNNYASILISIHAPLRGRQQRCPEWWPLVRISIHAPLRGRLTSLDPSRSRLLFQSTPPCGGDIWVKSGGSNSWKFQSTPPCGGDLEGSNSDVDYPISIHAPLRGRPALLRPCSVVTLFQSTPPCGGDQGSRRGPGAVPDFNPRPLAGATGGFRLFILAVQISIHAPLRGRRRPRKARKPCPEFQSTPPCGGDIYSPPSDLASSYFNPRPLAGATGWLWLLDHFCRISIHAPLRGRPVGVLAKLSCILFQSTPPCGGDMLNPIWMMMVRYFNPRPLAGATVTVMESLKALLISIHAPLRGRRCFMHSCTHSIDFNPRPLAGATPAPGAGMERPGFQSTPPCGGDDASKPHCAPMPISIHAPLRGRHHRLRPGAAFFYFNPRPLAGATEASMVSPSA